MPGSSAPRGHGPGPPGSLPPRPRSKPPCSGRVQGRPRHLPPRRRPGTRRAHLDFDRAVTRLLDPLLYWRLATDRPVVADVVDSFLTTVLRPAGPPGLGEAGDPALTSVHPDGRRPRAATSTGP